MEFIAYRGITSIVQLAQIAPADVNIFEIENT